MFNKETAKLYGARGGREPGPQSIARKLELKQRKVMETLIYKKTQPLIRAGMISAMGQNFVYRIDEERDSKGKLLSRKHVLVQDPFEIGQALDKMEAGGISEDGKFYYVTTEKPDVRAIEMLLNRAYGKPKESLTIDGEVKFSLKALAEERKKLFVESEDVSQSGEILLPEVKEIED